MLFNIKFDGISKSATINSKQDTILYIEFQETLKCVKFHKTDSKTNAIIKNQVINRKSIKISDLVTGFESLESYSGFWKNKYEFICSDGVCYAWKGKYGRYKLVGYPKKDMTLATLDASFNDVKITFSNSASFDAIKGVLDFILASAFGVLQFEAAAREGGGSDRGTDGSSYAYYADGGYDNHGHHHGGGDCGGGGNDGGGDCGGGGD